MLFTALCAPAFAQAPQITAVQVSGTAQPSILSAGAVASVLGSGFGTSASTIKVSVGPDPAYVISASNTQLGIELPVDLPTQGSATLTVTTPGGSASMTIPLGYASPAFVLTSANLPYVMDYKDKSSNVVPFLVDDTHPVVPGDYLEVRATGLGLINTPAVGPPVGVGPTPANASYNALVPPSFNIGSSLIPQAATVAVLQPGLVGVFKVTFQLPKYGIASGTDKFVLNASGFSTTPAVTFVNSGTAVISGIVNGASFAQGTPVAPGSIASVFSTNLESVQYNGVFPAADIHNTVVTFNSFNAPIYDLDGPADQVNVQVPVELPNAGPVTVVLTNSTGAGRPFALETAPSAPGIFRIHDKAGDENAAALFAATKWYAMPTAFAQELGILTNCKNGHVNVRSYCGQPASAGDNLEIYATGLGEATVDGDPNGTPLSTGSTAPTNPLVLYKTTVQPVVTIGGLTARVLFSGVAPGFAGLYQINVTVPSGVQPGNIIPVLISMPNSSVTDTATIAIQ